MLPEVGINRKPGFISSNYKLIKPDFLFIPTYYSPVTDSNIPHQSELEAFWVRLRGEQREAVILLLS